VNKVERLEVLHAGRDLSRHVDQTAVAATNCKIVYIIGNDKIKNCRHKSCIPSTVNYEVSYNLKLLFGNIMKVNNLITFYKK